MAAGGLICRRTGTIFGRTQLDHRGNNSGKFRKNPTSGHGGDAITRKTLRTYGWTPDGPCTGRAIKLVQD